MSIKCCSPLCHFTNYPDKSCQRSSHRLLHFLIRAKGHTCYCIFLKDFKKVFVKILVDWYRYLSLPHLPLFIISPWFNRQYFFTNQSWGKPFFIIMRIIIFKLFWRGLLHWHFQCWTSKKNEFVTKIDLLENYGTTRSRYTGFYSMFNTQYMIHSLK